jgi:dihydroorotate dehydrogenase electron transfer subunit
MPKRVTDFTIINNRRVNKEYYVLDILSDNELPELKPGQFAELRIDGADDVFLRRPISFYDVDYKNRTISLLIQEVGKGTRLLANASAGDKLNMIYPLGNAFTVEGEKNALLIGGGVGVAPLLLLGKTLKSNKTNVNFLLGFRNKDFLVDIAKFETYGKVYITTDDGSIGEKGTVLDHSVIKDGLKSFDKLYTCGPQVMMKAVAGLAEKENTTCEASLENTMACGFGACLCCVQKTIHGNLRVCVEGPVFNSKEIIW